MTSLYLIGSLRNPEVTVVAKQLRDAGYEVFDNWMAAGPEADDYWMKYSKEKGLSYKEALQSYEAKHVFSFDKYHLDRCDMAVLLLPAGKSGHLEVGYMAGCGKPTFALFPAEPDRYDVMYQFLDGVFFSVDELVQQLNLTMVVDEYSIEVNNFRSAGGSAISSTISPKVRQYKEPQNG